MGANDIECESVTTSLMRSDASECSTPPASPTESPCHTRKRKRSPQDEELRKQRLVERKKRNRESAERSRQRKLQYYKELEDSVEGLREENAKLKKEVAAKAALEAEVAALRKQLADAQHVKTNYTPTGTLINNTTNHPHTPVSPVTAMTTSTDNAPATVSSWNSSSVASINAGSGPAYLTKISETLDDIMSFISLPPMPSEPVEHEDLDFDLLQDTTDQDMIISEDGPAEFHPESTSLEADDLLVDASSFAKPESAAFNHGTSIDSPKNSTLVSIIPLQLERKQRKSTMQISSTMMKPGFILAKQFSMKIQSPILSAPCNHKSISFRCHF